MKFGLALTSEVWSPNIGFRSHVRNETELSNAKSPLRKLETGVVEELDNSVEMNGNPKNLVESIENE